MEDLPSKWRTKKKGEVAILVSDKMDFKPINIKKEKEGHYIMVKESIKKEELPILNIYAPKTGAPRYIKQVLFFLLHFRFWGICAEHAR